MTRVVAVLGYSDGTAGLHPVCGARLERAAEVARLDDVVLLSGWARSGKGTSEAELMARAWSGAEERLLLDRSARTTLGNALAVARAARSAGASDVVLVTSGWHARRARVLTRAALAGTGARLRLVTTTERPGPGARLRELACWSMVPVLALVAARAG